MQKKTIAASTAALLLGLAIVPATYAFQGDGQGSGTGGGQGLKLDPEVRIEIQEAMQSGDYDAFVAAHPEDVEPKLTEEQFDEMVEKHAERQDHKEAMEAALESGNYDVWAALIAEQNPDAPILEKITEENFDKFVELHELREQEKVLAEELGLEKGLGGGQEKGGLGQKQGRDQGMQRGKQGLGGFGSRGGFQN
jgi:hypothetical protein